MTKARSASLAIILFAGSVLAGPAAAQDEDFEQIVTIMRACAQIADVPARVTCYDNTIRPGIAVARTAPPARSTPAPLADHGQGFGSEMLPVPREVRSARNDETTSARVTAIERVEPGIYLLTLEDGAQWRFVDAAPETWSTPRAGAQIRLERGSLGSVFLSYDGQRRLRVRRTR
ncbi:MAG: hypothetical protein V4647_09215 [Pseudomonadota bacterium]